MKLHHSATGKKVPVPDFKVSTDPVNTYNSSINFSNGKITGGDYKETVSNAPQVSATNTAWHYRLFLSVTSPTHSTPVELNNLGFTGTVNATYDNRDRIRELKAEYSRNDPAIASITTLRYAGPIYDDEGRVTTSTGSFTYDDTSLTGGGGSLRYMNFRLNAIVSGTGN